MGLGGMIVSRGDAPMPGNPIPSQFRIVKATKVGRMWVSTIRYPDCTNFEGLKILVTRFDPNGHTSIDPHFTKGGGVVARFAPTLEGEGHAMAFAQMLSRV